MNFFNQGLEKDDSKNRTVIHTLRHTFASPIYMINGTPIFTIKTTRYWTDYLLCKLALTWEKNA